MIRKNLFSFLKISVTNSNFISTSCQRLSRVKRRFTMPPFWQPKKTRVLYPEELTQENQDFVSEKIAKQFQSPLKQTICERELWTPNSYRCGLITRKIGEYPMWSNTGKIIYTTLLHVADNHVIKYIPPEELMENDIHYQRRVQKKSRHLGALVIGAESADPRNFTKQYFNLFQEAGVMPKKRLSKFYITPNAKLQPGTPLLATHYKPGDYVDCRGITVDRGFQGVIIRWGFKGGRATHGVTKSHRRPGNIGGSGSGMARVWPGTKMPGHMGRESRTLRGQLILRINTKYNIIWVKGRSIPGEVGNYILLYDTVYFHGKKTEKDKDYFPTFNDEDAKLPENLYHEMIHPFNASSIVFEEDVKKKR